MTRRAALAVTVLGATFMVGLGVMWLGVSYAPTRSEDIAVEVAKSGAQLALLAVLGALVTGVFRYLDAEREDDRRRIEYRLGVLREVVASYNRIKAARRILRAYGFGRNESGDATSAQLREFVAQLRSLNDAQLSLEAIKRQVEADAGAFAHGNELIELLGCVEDYVHQVITDWEAGGADFRHVGGMARADAMPHLQELLASQGSSFRHGIADPMYQIQSIIGSGLRQGTRVDRSEVETTLAACRSGARAAATLRSTDERPIVPGAAARS